MRQLSAGIAHTGGAFEDISRESAGAEEKNGKVDNEGMRSREIANLTVAVNLSEFVNG
jgi:hypothetical protein